ncbi:unnamed protein product [Blepharisma stoltei]|uniref:U-box domain-containing protein n=1 Tax=Blepharisma stoltei TaxID=1481888 RepID=A0AAU9IR87_9CILI|nr:unnamed protein product [Blepharisma stoltei]
MESEEFDESTSIPDNYICPITQEIMINPVVAADGHSYEKEAILKWFKTGHLTSPLTNEKLSSFSVIDNFRLKAIIKDFKESLSEVQRQKQLKIEEERAMKEKEEAYKVNLEKIQEENKANLEFLEEEKEKVKKLKENVEQMEREAEKLQEKVEEMNLERKISYEDKIIEYIANNLSFELAFSIRQSLRYIY